MANKELNKVGLEDRGTGKKPSNFSGGSTARVATAVSSHS
jgi:ABC-type lipoprotein export system ATPase subunit